MDLLLTVASIMDPETMSRTISSSKLFYMFALTLHVSLGHI